MGIGHHYTTVLFERLFLTRFDFRYKQPIHRRVLYFLILLPWVLSILSFFFLCKSSTTLYGNVCQELFQKESEHKILFYCVFLAAPFVLNVLAYTAIVRRLFNKSRTTSKKIVSRPSMDPRMIMIRALMINITFTLPWLPFLVVTEGDTSGYHSTKHDVVQSLLYLNCLTDPLLYSFSSFFIRKFSEWFPGAREERVEQDKWFQYFQEVFLVQNFPASREGSPPLRVMSEETVVGDVIASNWILKRKTRLTENTTV